MKIAHARDEIHVYRAAHAAVVDFDDGSFVGGDQLAVDAYFAEPVHDDADLHRPGRVEDLIDGGRVAGAEKAGYYCRRDCHESHRGRLWRLPCGAARVGNARFLATSRPNCRGCLRGDHSWQELASRLTGFAGPVLDGEKAGDAALSTMGRA